MKTRGGRYVANSNPVDYIISEDEEKISRGDREKAGCSSFECRHGDDTTAAATAEVNFLRPPSFSFATGLNPAITPFAIPCTIFIHDDDDDDETKS